MASGAAGALAQMTQTLHRTCPDTTERSPDVHQMLHQTLPHMASGVHFDLLVQNAGGQLRRSHHWQSADLTLLRSLAASGPLQWSLREQVGRLHAGRRGVGPVCGPAAERARPAVTVLRQHAKEQVCSLTLCEHRVMVHQRQYSSECGSDSGRERLRHRNDGVLHLAL